jgi:hypothetical protein
LELRFFQTGYLVGELVEIRLAPLDIFLAFHQEDFLLLIMLLHSLGKGIFPVFEHLNHEFKLLV